MRIILNEDNIVGGYYCMRIILYEDSMIILYDDNIMTIILYEDNIV